MFVACGYCEKSIHRSSLTRHVKTQHTAEAKVQCQHCTGVYKNMDSLGKHQREVTTVLNNPQEIKKSAKWSETAIKSI